MIQKEIDFYIYELSDYHQYQRFVCRIVEEVYQKGLQILVLCENKDACQKLDEALWNFKETSFIPHIVQSHNSIVTLDLQSSLAKNPRSLLNTSYNFPPSCENYNQVIEMSGYDHSSRQKAREIFKQYKNMKFKINSVHI